jgi:uncharacterized metal-binding protein
VPADNGCVCTDTCRFYQGLPHKVPADCPSRVHPEVLEEARRIYQDPASDAHHLWQAFGRLLHTGGAKKSRVEHIVDYCRALEVSTLGIASCLRYIKEAHYLKGLFEEQGWRAHVAICKLGGFKVEDVAVEKDSDWIVCNPLGQALLLNKLGCQVNVTLGLCMGHEMIFNRYSQAYTTNLVVKEKISGERSLDTLHNIMVGEHRLRFHRFSSEEALGS